MRETIKPCPFCSLPASRILGGDELALIASDGYPVSPGHALIIPRRHVGSFFETTAAERASLLQLLDRAKALIDAEFHPDAFNIGINNGAAAAVRSPPARPPDPALRRRQPRPARRRALGASGEGEILGMSRMSLLQKSAPALRRWATLLHRRDVKIVPENPES